MGFIMKLGSINAAGIATLYKNRNPVAICLDTPNAIAYGFSKTGATRAVSWLGVWKSRDMKERVEAAGWMTSDKEARFKLI